MRLSVLPLILTVYSCNVFAEELVYKSDIVCEDISGINIFLGYFLYYITPVTTEDFPIPFYFATRRNRQPTEVNKNGSVRLESSGFDPSIPTYIAIHGYKSGGLKSWMLELKNKLLDNVDANVILVDWSNGSYCLNYVDSARNTQIVSDKLFIYLEELRSSAEKVKGSSSEIKWNHLHFIGHSLGAQISAQASYLLRQDKFWTIERITGLDPAKLCFAKAGKQVKLDKSDAKFVDVIHTQIGHGEVAFGDNKNIGHSDFYINGGVMQPECVGDSYSKLIPKLTKMICSHKLSYKYYIESLYNENNCAFRSYRWNGTHADARKVYKQKLDGGVCENCPRMGLDAAKYNDSGVFIVFTSAEKPYCDFAAAKHGYKVTKVMDKLETIVSVFNLTTPSVPSANTSSYKEAVSDVV